MSIIIWSCVSDVSAIILPISTGGIIYYSLHLTQLHTSCLASCQGGTVIADISLVQEGKTDRALWATISSIRKAAISLHIFHISRKAKQHIIFI